MSTRARVDIALVGVAILFASCIALLRVGLYGWTVFAVAPVLLGGLSTLLFPPTSPAQAAGTGALAILVTGFCIVLVRVEGAICLLMAAPLIVPLGALGGSLAFWAIHFHLRTRNLTILLLIPAATTSWDVKVQPEIFEVRTQVEVAAPPERVWKHVVTFSPLAEPHEWYFRAGVAYPKRAWIEGSGPGAIRYCEFSTGSFVEPIDVWDEPNLLRFKVTENPEPLREWSPYGPIQTKHLHGYLVSKQGEFRLAKLANGHTLLVGTTWYQHGLWPAEYWRWWSDAIIHRIHLRVLNQVRMLAEQGH
jgi:hypothetical protein